MLRATGKDGAGPRRMTGWAGQQASCGEETAGTLALCSWLLVALVTWPRCANTYSLRPSPGSCVHCKPRPSLAGSSFKSSLACKAELRRPDRLLRARLQSYHSALCAVNLHTFNTLVSKVTSTFRIPPSFREPEPLYGHVNGKNNCKEKQM